MTFKDYPELCNGQNDGKFSKGFRNVIEIRQTDRLRPENTSGRNEECVAGRGCRQAVVRGRLREKVVGVLVYEYASLDTFSSLSCFLMGYLFHLIGCRTFVEYIYTFKCFSLMVLFFVTYRLLCQPSRGLFEL